MKDDVEIGPVCQNAAPEEPVRQPGPVIVEPLAVGGQGDGDAAAGPELQAAEGRVQIGQAHVQLVPGGA